VNDVIRLEDRRDSMRDDDDRSALDRRHVRPKLALELDGARGFVCRRSAKWVY
jgi:hypothetical protein